MKLGRFDHRVVDSKGCEIIPNCSIRCINTGAIHPGPFHLFYDEDGRDEEADVMIHLGILASAYVEWSTAHRAYVLDGFEVLRTAE